MYIKKVITIIIMLFQFLVVGNNLCAIGDMTYYKDVKHDTGVYSIYIRRNASNEIDKLCAMYEGTTERIKDSQTEKEVCADALNNSRIYRLLRKRIIPKEAPPGEPLIYVGIDTRICQSPGGSYYITTPCMMRDSWKEDNVFRNGLNDYEKRKVVYEEVLLSAVLQDLTAENEDAYLTIIDDFLFAAANSASVPLDIKEMLDAALNGWDVSMGNGDTLKRVLEYLYTFLDKSDIPHLTVFKGLADKFADNLDNIALAVSTLNFIHDIGSAIFKGILINALALGEAELRLEALEQWRDEYRQDEYMDRALVYALDNVRDAFDEYKNGTWPAFRDALFTMEMGVSTAAFLSSVSSFLLSHAGTAIASCVGVGISWVGAYATLAITTWMGISSANHQAQVVCVASTLDYLLREKHLQDTCTRKNSRIVNIRNYLAYYYYLKNYELNTDSFLGLLDWFNIIDLGPWNDELLMYIDIQKQNYLEVLPPLYMPREDIPGFLTKICGPIDLYAPYVKDSHNDNSPDTNIILTFNEPMDSSSFTLNNIVLTGSTTGNIPFSFHYNEDEMRLTINPDSDLQYAEIITLVLDSSVKDLVGNPMLSPYSMSFSLSIPYQPPSYLIIPSLQIHPQQLDPYEPYTITGYVEDNHGDSLSAGTVEIRMDGRLIGTTGVHNGSFQIQLNAPDNDSLFPVNKNVFVEISNGQIATLDPRDFLVLTVNGYAPKNGYDFVSLKTYADVEGMTPVNETSRFSGEINSKVYVALQLEHLMVSCSIQFQFIRPDGSFYQEHIVAIDPNQVGESHLIIFVRNLGMGEYGLLGDWTCKVVVTPSGGEPEHVDSIRYTVGYKLQGHQLCESITGTPLRPVNPGNLFATDMAQIYSFVNFTDIAKVLQLRWLFKGPDNYEKEVLQVTNDPGYAGLAEYGVGAVFPIAGTEVENMCGDWSVEFYIMDEYNNYSLAGTDYFTILENPSLSPEITVSPENEEPIENQNLFIRVSVTDNNRLKKVVLHWKNGYSLYRTWDPVDTGEFEVIHSLGNMFEQGDIVEYWVEAWDSSGNYTHSLHQFIPIHQETVFPPHPPVIAQAVRHNVPVAVYSRGAYSDAGTGLEYQYDWGDGTISPWGTNNREHTYSLEGVFSVKGKARSISNPARESDWSGISFLTVDSTPPEIRIITNEGDTISSNNNIIIIEGTTFDPEPDSGIAYTSNNLNVPNEGTAENWRFSFPREEEFTTYSIMTEDNAGNISSVAIDLEPGPEIEYYPYNLDFPLTEVGGYSDMVVTVKNTGFGLYTGHVTVLSPFAIVSGNNINLTHDEEQTIVVRFSPDSEQEYNSQLDISGSIAFSLPLHGTGSDSPIMTLESGELDFGIVELGSFRELFIKITNSGFGVLTGIVEVPPPFFIEPGEDSYSLLHNETASIPIRFEPAAEELSTYDLIFDSEGSNECILVGMGSQEPVLYSFIHGDGNPSSRVNTLYMIRDYNYQYVDTQELKAGKGKSGRFIDSWLHYPDLINVSGDGIPYNARISFGTLLFHIRDYQIQGSTPLIISLYRIKDPSNLGTPVYPVISGFRGGLDYYYRDNRPGRNIPWRSPEGTMMDLIGSYEPSAQVSLDPESIRKNNITRVAFDVTGDLKAWLDGEENQGWVLVCSTTTQPGNTVEFFSIHTLDEQLRPALIVSYDTNTGVIPPEPVVSFEGVCGDNEITLEWELPVSEFTGVRIIRKKGVEPVHPYDGSIVIDTVTETSYTDKRLENGQDYYYNIYLYNGPMNFSKTRTLKLIPGTPQPPVMIEPLIGPGYVFIKWEAVSDADYYRVYRKNPDSGKLIFLGDVKEDYFLDENIGLTEYIYEIHACNINGEGPAAIFPIEDIPVAVESPEPAEITNLFLSENFQIVIEWLSSGTRESGYILERSITGEPWQTLCELDFTCRRYIDKDIIPDTRIGYRLYSKNSAGTSDEFDMDFIDVPNFPGKPENFRWNFVNSSLLKMEWDQPVENIEEYNITQYDLEMNPVSMEIISGESRSHYIHGIVPEQLFFYSLTAVNILGEQTLVTEYIMNNPEMKPDLPYVYTPPAIVHSVPGGLTVLPHTPHSLIIKWSPAPGAQHYELFCSPLENGEYHLIYQGKETFYYDTALTTGIPYYYRIQAVYTDGRSSFSQPVRGIIEELISLPAICENFAIYREDLSAISLQWDSEQNSATYRLLRSENPELNEWAVVYSGNLTSFTDRNLNPGTRYFYKVYGINSSGPGPFSNIILGTTKKRPFTPYIHQINTIAVDTLQVIWDSYGLAEGFHLYRGPSFYGPYTLVYLGTNNEYNDTGLDEGTDYYYKVVAINSYGSSVDSFPVHGTTGIIPLPPDNLRMESNTLTTIRLRWDTAEHAESYTLYRSLTEEDGYMAIYSGTEPVFDDTSLTPGTGYYYRVQGTGSFGSSELSSAIATRTGSLLPPPLGLTIEEGNTIDSLIISWNPVESAISYALYFSEDPDGEYQLLTEVTQEYYMHDSLLSNSHYYYKIASVNEFGTGPLSEGETGLTGSLPSLPSGFAISGMTIHSITIEWNEAPFTEEYSLYRDSDPSGPFNNEIYSGSQLTFVDSSLSPHSTYYYKIISGNRYGESISSDYITGTTLSIVTIAATARNSYAILSDGSAWGWGTNSRGQLGDGSTVSTSTPRYLPDLINIKKITGGTEYNHYALTHDGFVYAWGDNSDGFLGLGNKINTYVPTQIPQLSNIQDISAGNTHVLALDSGGNVWSWGANESGEIGDGTTNEYLSPIRLTGLPVMTQIAAGDELSLALDNNGNVWGWGRTSNGRLGTGQDTQSPYYETRPVQLPGLNNIIQIHCGAWHGLALRNDGILYIWGDNQYGQQGNGLRDEGIPLQYVNYQPVQVPGMANVAEILKGFSSSDRILIKKNDQTIWGWGANHLNVGAIGTGDDQVECYLEPIQAAVVPQNYSDIALGDIHTLFITSEGILMSWGSNSYGRLGDGTTQNHPQPVEVVW